ncbi:MAG TPA: PDZ domain-containing protein [Rhodanobacteraceae bacterium]|nr:PDZ domain-containing protein [Rhodanobacteraceae bacterium]
MNSLRKLRPFIVTSILLLAGCATGPGTIFTPTPKPLPPEETGNYEPVAGRGAELVADLRAAPPPAQPEVADGKSEGTDEKRLGAQSVLRIGTSHFAATDPHARDNALRQAERVGADRVNFYAGADALTVVYYVRFKLPFGATFRDLRENERNQTGADGGVAIGSVVNDSPAARANLLAGDIVLKCDEKAVAGRADFQSCLRARAGHPVTLTIVRNGETMQRMVRLGPLASSG